MAEFARGAEKRIFHGFFRRAENVADGPQLQALIVLHFKNNAFARRQALHRRGDARLDFLADKRALRVLRRAMLALALEEIGNAFFVEARIQLGWLVFGARLAAAQVIQADVGDDAVEPGIEAALEAETVEIAVDLEEGLLVDVPGVLGALHQVQRQAQDVPVEAAHQFLESRTAARLRFRDQGPLVDVGQRDHRGQGGVRATRATVVIGQSQSPSGKRHISLSFRVRQRLLLVKQELSPNSGIGPTPRTTGPPNLDALLPPWVSTAT